tara:strand:+ start:427 stop:534 length:108 start_codon:yes stop_codon:yes gene_type:complete
MSARRKAIVRCVSSSKLTPFGKGSGPFHFENVAVE